MAFTTTASVTAAGTSFTIYLKRTRFELNSYTSNYASNGGAILRIRGLQFFEVVSETFKNNGDAFNEILT